MADDDARSRCWLVWVANHSDRNVQRFMNYIPSSPFRYASNLQSESERERPDATPALHCTTDSTGGIYAIC